MRHNFEKNLKVSQICNLVWDTISRIKNNIMHDWVNFHISGEWLTIYTSKIDMWPKTTPREAGLIFSVYNTVPGFGENVILPLTGRGTCFGHQRLDHQVWRERHTKRHIDHNLGDPYVIMTWYTRDFWWLECTISKPVVFSL